MRRRSQSSGFSAKMEMIVYVIVLFILLSAVFH